MQVNQHQFNTWHDRYRPRLLNSMTAVVRNRDTAEDVTAAALTAAWRHLHQFRGESSLWTWVYRVALNEASAARRERARFSSIDAANAPEPSEPDLLAQALERSECCEKIRGALRQIPALYRRVLTDHFVRGYSIERIARQHKVPVGTVLSRIFKAKRLLRAAWEA